MEQFRNDMDRLFREEMRNSAHELAAEAWNEGLHVGIDPDIMAEAMVQAIIGELARARGDGDAAALAEKISRLAHEGRFMAPRLLQ